jgi:hypothetical protein
MADITKTVSVLFQGTDDLSNVIKSMGKNIDAFGDDLADIGAPFAELTEQALALSAAVAGVALAGLLVSASIENETGKMTAALGLTNEEAERFADIAKEAYKAGWGEDLAGAFEAVTLAQQKLGDNASTDIGKVTENALKLQSVFGVEINDSLGAVSTLMANFGLNATQAFDFVTAGFQKGLDGSGDFLESINEYSTQFANGGADAAQFFSVMESGFSEGMLGTDRAADLFKEFRVRIQDESKTTREALESIGLDPEAFAANMASGELSAVEAFNAVQKALNDTQDKTVQFNAGVGLMGTQFEDMGTKAALALETTTQSMGTLAGTLDKIDPDLFSKKFISAIRTITTEFGDLQEWDQVKDNLGQIFEDIAASFGPAMDNVDFTGLEDKVGKIWDTLVGVFTDADLDITTLEGMEHAIQLVIDSVESLATVVGGILDTLAPVAAAVIDLVKEFNDLPDGVQKAAGVVLGLGTALVALGTAISVGGTLVSALGTFAGLFGASGALVAGLGILITVLTGPIGVVVGLAALAAAVADFSLGNIAEEHERTMTALDREHEAVQVLLDDLAEISTLTATSEVFILIEEGKLDEAREKIAELTAQDNEITLTAELDAQDASDVWADLVEEFSDEVVEVPVEAPGLEAVIEKIEEIPTEKLVEIKLQGDIDKTIAQIVASAEVAQSAFEWTAQVNIAEIEAAGEVGVAAFDAIGQSVEALSVSTSDMFGSLLNQWGELSNLDRTVLFRNVEAQQALQAKALDSQIELNTAQAEYLNARAEQAKSGKAQITVDTTGVEPAIEMVLWQILEKVQIRATESASEFLLGLGGL